MRFLISISFLLLFTLSSCAQGTAGLSIPPGETFVLGEYRKSGFKATVNNNGTQEVTATVIDRKTGDALRNVPVPPGERASVTVTAAEVLHLENDGDTEANLSVKSPVKGREGMSYFTPGENKEAKIKLPVTPPVTATDEGDGMGETNASATLSPGQTLVIGEGSSKNYSVNIRNSGAEIKVSGRSKASGEQLQGFGLPKRGRETVNIRPNENLHLTNTSGEPTTVKVTMSKPVRGARVMD